MVNIWIFIMNSRNMVMTIMVNAKLAYSIKVLDFSDCHEKFVPAVLCIVFTGTCTSWFTYLYK